VPESRTAAVGVGETAYRVTAVALGTVAGVCALGGPAILVHRRRTAGPVFSATTRNDKAVYVSLTAAIALGPAATVGASILGGGYNYRATISPWFRSIFSVRPAPGLMSGAPPLCKLHALSALLLFAIWPFTRLVHLLTAPGLPHSPLHHPPQPRPPAGPEGTAPRPGTHRLTSRGKTGGVRVRGPRRVSPASRGGRPAAAAGRARKRRCDRWLSS
jgi:hypothetical protein